LRCRCWRLSALSHGSLIPTTTYIMHHIVLSKRRLGSGSGRYHSERCVAPLRKKVGVSYTWRVPVASTRGCHEQKSSISRHPINPFGTCSETMITAVRVRVETMGSQKCRIVGKSQSGRIMIHPMIFTRTRTSLTLPCHAREEVRGVVGHASHKRGLVDRCLRR
jgi:hypothetical protein